MHEREGLRRHSSPSVAEFLADALRRCSVTVRRVGGRSLTGTPVQPSSASCLLDGMRLLLVATTTDAGGAA